MLTSRLPAHLALPIIRGKLVQRFRKARYCFVGISRAHLPSASPGHQQVRSAIPQAQNRQTGPHGLQHGIATGVMQAGIKKAISLVIGPQHCLARQAARKSHALRHAQPLRFGLQKGTQRPVADDAVTQLLVR